MAKIFIEDAYCLGLLYSYIFANKKMVLKSDLDYFYEAIENNLKDTDVMDIYATIWYDNDLSIYFSSKGKYNEVYYVLYPELDIERAKSKYIGCLSAKVLVASQKENALNCLGLQLVDGNIIQKETIDDSMLNTSAFMTKFLEKLKNKELKIESCPEVEDKKLTEEFIINQLESYQKLLNSGIIDKTTNKEQELVKKLTLIKK